MDLYTWDYRNRLTGIVTEDGSNNVLKTVGYEYDVDDQRVSKTVDGVRESYYLDRNQIAFVTDGSGLETFHYLYGLDVDAVLAQDLSTGMVWSLADRLGSIDLLTDKDGVVVDRRSFDSFGRLISESNPSVSFRYGYTARELDLESGLHYYRARFYDVGVGRFISVDPMGFDAGDTNLYRYVSNNSTNATDPTGLWINFAVGAAIGGGLDLGLQLWQNGGDFSKVDWASVGVSTVTGAIGGGIGGYLSKQGVGLAARTAITAGAEFNLGYWGKVGQNAISGKDDVFDGAMLSGALGGLSGAGGELLQAGVGKAWQKVAYPQNFGQAAKQVGGNTVHYETFGWSQHIDNYPELANTANLMKWNPSQSESILTDGLKQVRTNLLKQNDLAMVGKTARNLGIDINEDVLFKIKQYNFNSPGINFNVDNYSKWQRLASGKATLKG